MAERITGAQALIRALEHEGVELMFGLPGGCILPAYDPLVESPIRHVLVRHEQGAGHMAEGFAPVAGEVGVAMVTSGLHYFVSTSPYRPSLFSLPLYFLLLHSQSFSMSSPSAPYLSAFTIFTSYDLVAQ